MSTGTDIITSNFNITCALALGWEEIRLKDHSHVYYKMFNDDGVAWSNFCRSTELRVFWKDDDTCWCCAVELIREGWLVHCKNANFIWIDEKGQEISSDSHEGIAVMKAYIVYRSRIMTK